MLSIAVILKSLLGILLSALLFYVVGRLFNYILNKKTYWGWFPTYFYALCGMILSICSFAIYKTHGITILLIIPLLLTLFSKAFHKQFKFEEVTGFKERIGPFIFLSISILVAYLYYVQSFRIEGENIFYIWGDQEYYARVAENISFNGIENMRVEYLYPERFTVEPFHYADLWSVALAFTLASVKPIFGGVLVAFPFLMALTALGIAAIMKHFILEDKKTYVLYILIATCLIGGFKILFPTFLFPGSIDVYSSSVSNYTKLLWCASLLPLIYTLILNKSDNLIVYLVFIIGLGFINVLTSLAMGSFLWVTYISFKRKTLLPNLTRIFWLSVVAVIFVYLLYGFYPSLSPIKRPLTGKAVFSIDGIITNLRTSLNIFIGGLLQFFVYLPPLLLLLLHFLLDKIKFKNLPIFNVVLYSLIVMTSSVFVWAVLYTTTIDSVQFFHNIFVIIGSLLSAILYSYILIKSERKIFKVLAIAFIVLSIYQNIDYNINTRQINKSECNALLQFINGNTDTYKTFAHYKELMDYTSDFSLSNTIITIPYSFVGYNIRKYENYSLNLPFIKLSANPKDKLFQINNITWAPISFFKNMPGNQTLNEVELMSVFMKYYKINFLCVPANTSIPFELKLLTVDSLSTPKMGWKIYKCVYNN